MKESPILFSTEMVKAILQGRKTQTRRVVKHEMPNEQMNAPTIIAAVTHEGVHFKNTDHSKEQTFFCGVKCPYGQVGDILWVRETWQRECIPFSDGVGVGLKTTGEYLYKANGDVLPKRSSTLVFSKWKPSIHMPKEACRLKLRITNIRVERLQDITHDDAAREGVIQNGSARPITLFQDLWSRINGEQSWNDNPWVWVIEFEKL